MKTQTKTLRVKYANGEDTKINCTSFETLEDGGVLAKNGQEDVAYFHNVLSAILEEVVEDKEEKKP